MEGDRTGPERNRNAGRGVGLTDDDLYRVLASTRRRRVLYVLLDQGEVTIQELANVLAGWDATDAGGMVTGDGYERIRIDLVHVHLPVLESSELVTYDRDRDVVELEAVRPAVRELVVRSVESQPAAGQ